MERILSAFLYLTTIALVLYTSLLCASLFRFKSAIPYLISIYLFSFSNIVLVSEIAGTLNLLNNKYFFLAIHLILLGSLYLLWIKNGKPGICEPIKLLIHKTRQINIRDSFRSHPDLWLLGTVVVLIYSFGIFLILKVPPNNYDSMTCHMTRIAYWLQHGNYSPWATWDYTQQVYPINAQVQMLWSILFWGWDLFAGFAQWFASLAAILAIYGIARVIGWSRPQSLFASLVCSVFPEILLESTSVQNHLVAASLVACSFYFLFLGFKSMSKTSLGLSSLAIALALGTHQFAFFILPGMGVTICLLWIKYRKSASKLIPFFAITSVLSLFIFGSYMYIVNFKLYGNPFVDASSLAWSPPLPIKETETQTINNYWTPRMVLGWTKNNLGRYIHTSFDLTGLPPVIKTPLYDIREKVSIFLFNLTRIPQKSNHFNILWRNMSAHEDTAWFGILGFFLFYPLILVQGINGLKNRDPMKLGLLLAMFLYVFIWAGLIIRNMGWSIYQGRYFILIALLFAPFIASVYRKGLTSRILCWMVVFLSIYIAGYTLINNVSKPLTGSASIWKLNRLEMVYINNPSQMSLVQSVDSHVPADEKLGLMLVTNTFEYPFFGKELERQLVPIYPDALLSDRLWLSQNGLNWILVCTSTKVIPTGYKEIPIPEVHSGYLAANCRLLKKIP